MGRRSVNGCLRDEINLAWRHWAVRTVVNMSGCRFMLICINITRWLKCNWHDISKPMNGDYDSFLYPLIWVVASGCVDYQVCNRHSIEFEDLYPQASSSHGDSVGRGKYRTFDLLFTGSRGSCMAHWERKKDLHWGIGNTGFSQILMPTIFLICWCWQMEVEF